MCDLDHVVALGCSRDRSSIGGTAAIVTVWVGVVIAAGRETTAITLHPPHSVIPGKKGSLHRHPPVSRPYRTVGRDRRRIAQGASYNRRLLVKCVSNFTENCKLNAIDLRKSSSSGGSAPPLGVIDPIRARIMTPRQDRGDRSRIERRDFKYRSVCEYATLVLCADSIVVVSFKGARCSPKL